MTRDITPAGSPATGAVDEAFAEVRASSDRFCLAAGIKALGTMMEADVTAACGPRHGRDAARRAHRWGRTQGRIGFHGGKVEVEGPRVRGVDGREVTIPSWETAAQEDWLGRWAMNLMLINVSTRRVGRAVRLPEGDVPAPPGSGVSKSAASRRFVALSAARLADFMAADLSALDLLVVQIDGLHLGDDLVLVAAIGVDGEGNKHPLALVEGECRNGSGPAGQPGLARDKEVDRRDRVGVIAEKRSPTLRRWPRVAAHVPSDRRLGDLEAELEQLTMNTRRAPKCVRTAHLANERAQLSRNLRSANTVAGSPAPIRPKPSTVPPNDGLRPDNRNHLKDGRKPAIEPNK